MLLKTKIGLKLRDIFLPIALSLFLCLSLSLFPSNSFSSDPPPLMGPAYQGPKCKIAVGEFQVAIPGAPKIIGNGLREMLLTAMFESNHFIVLDRAEPAGITAEKLLSEEFLSDADAILGQAEVADLMAYGAVTTLKGGGWGVVFKVPGTVAKAGGGYHQTRVGIGLRVVDTASGRIVAQTEIEGSALSGKALAGTTVGGMDLPVEMEVFKNTPYELALRDCIYRAVIALCQQLPPNFFSHR